MSEGTLNVLPQSFLQDAAKIRNILNDFIILIKNLCQAYKRLSELCDNVAGLDKATICRVHSPDSCRVVNITTCTTSLGGKNGNAEDSYCGGAYKIECCPCPNVDGELDYICKMAKVRTFVVRFIFLVFTSDPHWGSLFL